MTCGVRVDISKTMCRKKVDTQCGPVYHTIQIVHYYAKLLAFVVELTSLHKMLSEDFEWYSCLAIESLGNVLKQADFDFFLLDECTQLISRLSVCVCVRLQAYLAAAVQLANHFTLDLQHCMRLHSMSNCIY